MSKVVLHIGTHKTATTTIQDTFFKNSALLAKHGIVYPRQGKAAGHHGLAHDWGDMPAIYKLPEGSREALRNLAKTYAKSDRTLFLSSEEFSRADPKAAMDFAEIRALLSDFDEIEVVCVVRHQWQFIQSVYLELSRVYLTPRPPLLVGNSIRNGTVAGLWADYNLMLDWLEQSFAPEEITLLDFNTVLAAEGGILGAMLRHLGTSLEAGALETVHGGASNVSPMALGSWTANLLAEPKPAPSWLVESTSRLLHEEFGEGIKTCLFTKEEFRRLKDHFDAKNELLAARRAKVQQGFRITPASADGLTLFRNDIGASFWLKAARSFVAHRMT